MNRRFLGDSMTDAQTADRKGPQDRVLTADFVGIGPRGFVLNKEAWLGRHRSGDFRYLSLEQREANLRTYADSAILLVTEESRSTYKGQPVSVGALRATFTFVRQRDAWRLAGAQYSPILGAP
jgi:ketosteroid isomerase-like protein